MATCVNTSLPQYKQLLKDSKLPSLLLEMRVSKYLENNNGKFPSLEEVLVSSNKLLYQLNNKKIENQSIQELDDYLLNFLKQFGVKSKEFEELKSRLGIDALGATDVLNKLIWYTKNRNEETVPEEAGHMIVMLMGEKHPDIKELLINIKTWSEYEQIKNEYLPIYKDEEKVKIEAVGKLIAKALVKNYKTEGLDQSKLQKALKNILEYIKSILESFDLSNIFFYNQSIADHIAINILSGNKDYIYKITNLNKNLNAEKEINNNPLAKKTIDTFSSKNVKMTGSLAIAGTENIRRPEGQGIHDIDFKVKSFEIYQKEILSKMPENAVPAHFGWHKKSYSTFSYLIPKENFIINVKNRKDDFSNGWITEYDLLNERGEVVEKTQFNITAVDFFVYKDDYNQKDFDFDSNFVPASLVYEGKLSLSGKSNSYFFSRDKDQEDYVLRNPKSFVSFEKSNFYQLNTIKPGVQELFDEASVIQQDIDRANDAVIKLLEQLKTNTNVNYELISTQEAIDLIGDAYNGEKGFYYRGTVYLLKDKLNSTTAIHEFAHPFVDMIYETNRVLFDKLYNQFIITPEGAKIKEFIDNNYSEYSETDKKKELFVRILTNSALGLIQNQQSKNIVDKILFYIKQLFRKIFNTNKIDLNTTIDDLANILLNNKINVMSKGITQSDIIQFDRENRQLAEELSKMSKDSLGRMMEDTLIILQRSSQNIRDKNSRYRDVKKATTLNDKNQINKALSLVNESKNTQDDNKRAISFGYTLSTIKDVSNMLYERVKELNSDNSITPQDKMGTLSYYGYLINEWIYLIDNIDVVLREENISGSSPLSQVLASIRQNLKKSVDEISNNDLNTIVDILENMLKETTENAKKEHNDLVNRLEKAYGKGNPKIQDKIKESEQKLKERTFDKETIKKYLLGMMGDANYLSGFLQAYITHPDPIVAGFSKFLTMMQYEVEAKVRQRIQDMANKAGKVFNDLGLDKNDTERIGNKLLFIDKVLQYNAETGQMEQGEVYTLLNKFKDYRYEIDNLNYQIQEAIRLGKTQEADKLKQDLKSLEELWFHREYSDEYYNLQKIWDTPIGKIAKKRRSDIIQEINLKNDTLSKDPTLREEQLEEIRHLWKKFSQLSSLTDENGKPKVDTQDNPELSVAKLIKEYQEKSKEFYEDVEKTGLFEQRYEEEKRRLIDIEKLEEGSDEYKKAIDKWIEANTRTVIKQSFFEERDRISERLKEIYNLLPDAVKKDKDFGDIYQDIFNITKGYRDKDGQLMGSDFNEQQLAKIKSLQEEVENLKKTFMTFTGLTKNESAELSYYYDLRKINALTEEENKRMNELINKKSTILTNEQKISFLNLLQELNDLQSKVPTKYYLDKINYFLQNENVEYTEQNIDSLYNETRLNEYFNKYPEFKKWFLDNHFKMDKFDYDTKTSYQKYVRTYAWTRIVPNSSAYYESYGTMSDGKVIQGVPTNEYYNRRIRNDYRTLAWLRSQTKLSEYNQKKLKKLEELEKQGKLVSHENKKVEGVNVDHQGRWLPKELPNSPYINQDYYRLQNQEPKYFELLQVYTNALLDVQKGASHVNKLGYDLPRFWLTELENIKQTNVKDKVVTVFDKVANGLQALFTKSEDDFNRGLANYSDDLTKRMVFTDLFGNKVAKIPIKGLSRIPLNKVSKNIGTSISNYISSLEMNKKLVEINPIAKALLNTVESNGVKELGQISSTINKTRGIDMLANSNTNKRHQILKNQYEKVFEGVLIKDNLPIWARKSVNTLLGLASWGSLAANIPGNIKNSITANIQNFIESMGGQYINKSDFLTGKIKSGKFLHNMMKDYSKLGNLSLETQMYEAFDFVQGTSHTGEQFNKNLVSEILSLRFLYAGQQFGEVEAQLSFGLGVLEHIKIPQTINGVTKEIPYNEAFELVNGIMTLKPGIDKKYAEGGEFFNEKKMLIHDLVRSLQGNYAKSTAPEIERYTLLRLFTFMRKYLVPSVMNRFGTDRLQIGRADFAEGYYITSAKYLMQIIKDKQLNWGLLSDAEKANVRKMLTEATTVLMLYLLLRLLGYDDDDKNKIKKLQDNSFLTNHIIYQLLAVKSETEQFIPIYGMGLDELMRLKSSPSIALGHLDKYYRLLGDVINLMGYPMGLTDEDDIRYSRKVGVWDKGTLKIIPHATKILGFTGTTFEPEVGIQNLSTFTSRLR